jgi:selenocysteine lyase/cysteine desulfurase
MKDVRKDFPVVNHHMYLDNASVGPMSESLLEWRNENDIDFLIGGSQYRQTNKDFIEKVRKKTAQFIDADPHYLALIPNFSYGFNALLEGIPKPAKVLLLENDYPSVTWAVESRNFEIYYVWKNTLLRQFKSTNQIFLFLVWYNTSTGLRLILIF